MGFKPKRKVYVLKFQDDDLEGLEVKARSVPSGTLMEMMDLADVAERRKSTGPIVDARDADEDADDIDPETKEMIKAVRRLFEQFAKALVSWNVEEDDGQPVPANLDGLYSQDFPFVLDIIKSWMDAVGGVSAPLGQTSSDGDPSLAASIPMETASPSLAS